MKMESIGKMAINGLVMIFGTAVAAIGCKGVEDVAPEIFESIKTMIKFKK